MVKLMYKLEKHVVVYRLVNTIAMFFWDRFINKNTG